MKKLISYFIIVLFFLGLNVYSQVGIGTDQPRAMLHINSGPNEENNGIIFPIDKKLPEIKNHKKEREGMLIFKRSFDNDSLNIPNGFYYWIGGKWQKLGRLPANGIVEFNNKVELGGELNKSTSIDLKKFSLNFPSTATEGTSHFSVDGSTFNVDAVNNRIGIGITNPLGELHISNKSINRKIILYQEALKNNDHEFFGFGLGLQALRYHVGATTESHIFYAGKDATSSNELMRIQGNGNVGIGTSEPHGELQFNSTNNKRRIVLYEIANNTNQFQGFGVAPKEATYQVSDLVTDHVFYAGKDAASSNELMRIKGNGNVGIGTSKPTATLEVSGKIKITGGNPGEGKFLISDKDGLATWGELPHGDPMPPINTLIGVTENITHKKYLDRDIYSLVIPFEVLKGNSSEYTFAENKYLTNIKDIYSFKIVKLDKLDGSIKSIISNDITNYEVSTRTFINGYGSIYQVLNKGFYKAIIEYTKN